MERATVVLVLIVALGSLSLVVANSCDKGSASPTGGDTRNAGPASDVLIETDKSSYGIGEDIIVTIRNNLDVSIVTFDHQSFCSIVTFERRDNSGWERVAPCFSMKPTRPVSLGPNSDTVLTFRGLVGPDVYPGLQLPGTYRATFVFTVGESFDFGETVVVSSAPFSVE